jgi:hypothetical protein
MAARAPAGLHGERHEGEDEAERHAQPAQCFGCVFEPASACHEQELEEETQAREGQDEGQCRALLAVGGARQEASGPRHTDRTEPELGR